MIEDPMGNEPANSGRATPPPPKDEWLLIVTVLAMGSTRVHQLSLVFEDQAAAAAAYRLAGAEAGLITLSNPKGESITFGGRAVVTLSLTIHKNYDEACW